MSWIKEKLRSFDWGLAVLGAAIGWLLRDPNASARASGAAPAADVGTRLKEQPQPEPVPGTAARTEISTEADIAPASRQTPGALEGTISLVLSFVAGISFLIVYWSGANNTWLGLTLGISFAAFGAALVFWAHRLIRDRAVSGAREEISAGAKERDVAAHDFLEGEAQVERRGLLKWMSAAIITTFGAAIISLFRSLGKPPAPSLFAANWIRGQRLVTTTGDAVSLQSLRPGDSIPVFPEGKVGNEDAQTVLIRLSEELQRVTPPKPGWAPNGYVAYSRVCTHAGCPVGIFQAQTGLLLCPCHQSTFDVVASARPTAGPAARPLPQLPLYVDDSGHLCAGGDFSAPPGPGFWRMS